MLIQPITYKDFNGNERTEQFYFNLSETDVIELQAYSTRGIQEDLQDAINSNSAGQILDWIKMIVRKSYGVKSDDGRHFHRSAQITEDFMNSAAYNSFILSLFKNNGAKGIEFINALLNEELLRSALAQIGEGNEALLQPNAREIFEQRQAEKNIPAPQVVQEPVQQPPQPTSAPTQITPDFVGAPTEVPQTRAEAREQTISGFSESEIAAAKDADYQAWLAERNAAQGQ